MFLSDDTVELIVNCYDTSKAYVKESDHVNHAEEFVRMLVGHGYEFTEVTEELGEHDTALSEAIDNLTDELSENHDEGW